MYVFPKKNISVLLIRYLEYITRALKVHSLD
jgi:hypothetical protein